MLLKVNSSRAILFERKLIVQVYEAVPEFKVQGAGVLFNLNGQHALEAIDPALHEKYVYFFTKTYLCERYD